VLNNFRVDLEIEKEARENAEQRITELEQELQAPEVVEETELHITQHHLVLRKKRKLDELDQTDADLRPSAKRRKLVA